jgi:predicted dehydrogenase
MKIALVGFSPASRGVAEAALKNNNDLSGVCSHFTAAATTWITAHGVPIYSVPGRMLNIRGLDAAVVSSHKPISAPFVVKALGQGTHVYVSGRPNFTANDIGALDKGVTSGSGKLFFETHLDHARGLNTLAVQCAQGKIGDAGFIKIHSAWSMPPRNKRSKGGVVTDELVHQFRWLIRYFGGVKKVFAQGVRKGGKRPLDYAMITLTMKKNLLVQVIGSYQSGIDSFCRAEICGTDGMIQFNSAESPVQSTTKKASRPDPNTYPDEHWRDFEALVHGRSKGIQEAKQYLQAQRVASSALRSMKTDKPIML